MGRIESKSVWVCIQSLQRHSWGREALEGLESSGEVVGPKEVCQVRFELLMGVVEVAFDGSTLDDSVHAVGLGQSMLDPMKDVEFVGGTTD